MKLRSVDRVESNYHHQKETVESKYAFLFRGNRKPIYRLLIQFVPRLFAFSRLIIRLLLHGYKPKICQSRDREQNIYWYAYYPLSGRSKLLASEAEIKQWLELTQEI